MASAANLEARTYLLLWLPAQRNLSYFKPHLSKSVAVSVSWRCRR
jgi:hypothetical protein